MYATQLRCKLTSKSEQREMLNKNLLEATLPMVVKVCQSEVVMTRSTIHAIDTGRLPCSKKAKWPKLLKRLRKLFN
jgi:hypothetical protein